MQDIFHAFVKAGVGSGLNLALGILRNKLIAIALGPQGMGVLALLQQLQATALPIATLGGDAPLVQGLASRKEQERDDFLASAAIGLLSSWIICLIIFSMILPFLGSKIFTSETFLNPHTLRMMFLPVFFSSVGIFFLSLLTAVGAVGTLQKSQLIGNIFGVIAALPLLFFWQSNETYLLVLYLLVAPVFSLLAAFVFSIRLPRTRELLANFTLKNAKTREIKSYLHFGGTTLITGLIVTSTWFVVRTNIARKLGTESLGHFSAVVSLSGLSLTLTGTALSSFYMPRFAAANEEERPRILRQVLKLILPIALFVFLVLITFPQIFLETLFSREFIQASSLLKWWAAGDLMRTISYVFGYTILAGRHLRFTFASEIIFTALLLAGFSFSIMESRNLENLGQVYFCMYALYLAASFLFCKKMSYI